MHVHTPTCILHMNTSPPYPFYSTTTVRDAGSDAVVVDTSLTYERTFALLFVVYMPLRRAGLQRRRIHTCIPNLSSDYDLCYPMMNDYTAQAHGLEHNLHR